MIRHKYTLSEEEIQTLLSGIINLGQEETYKKMRERMIVAKDGAEDVDEMCMDMYEGMLQRARIFEEKSTEPGMPDIKKTLYQLASMLRILAHDMHKFYKNRQNNSGRFLELV